MPKMEKVTVDSISNGAAVERLNFELQTVLENILNANTSPIAIREINLKVKIKPSDDRSVASVTIQATSKLAPVIEHITQLYIGTDIHGTPEASEVIQPTLFPEIDNITQMKKGGTIND